MTQFASGSVGNLLTRMVGVWHDHVTAFALDGTPLEVDDFAGVPGELPFDNLVYIDFDGKKYRQTNVTFRGRPILHVRSFTGVLRDGILHFDKLGPEDPGHIGVSGGDNILIFCSARYNEATLRYSEPDFIHLISPHERLRSTILYRHGVAVRTLLARGSKLTPDTSTRMAFDPRGSSGSVHNERSVTTVYQEDKNG
jgi:hypothetical protein